MMDLDLCLGPQRQKSSWNGESGEAEGRNLAALDKPTHGNKAQLSSPPKQCRRGKKNIYQGILFASRTMGPVRGRGCWKQMLASPLVAVLVHGRAFLVFLFKLLTDSFGSSALISLRTTRLLTIAAWTPCLIVHNSFWLGIAWPRLQGVTNSPYTGNSGCAQ